MALKDVLRSNGDLRPLSCDRACRLGVTNPRIDWPPTMFMAALGAENGYSDVGKAIEHDHVRAQTGRNWPLRNWALCHDRYHSKH